MFIVCCTWCGELSRSLPLSAPSVRQMESGLQPPSITDGGDICSSYPEICVEPLLVILGCAAPLSPFPDTFVIVISKLFTVIALNAMTVRLYS